MRFIFIQFLLSISSFYFANSSQSDFKLESSNILLSKGSSFDLKIDVTIPEGQHIYLKKSKDSKNQVTNFYLSQTKGLRLELLSLPKGITEDEHLILNGKGRNKSAGSFFVRIYETAGKTQDIIKGIKFIIKSQLCESATKICYKPAILNYPLNISIKPIQFPRSLKQKFSAPNFSTGGVNWVSSYDAAFNQASQNNQNVFVVVTAPTWCGYCVVLERDVFNKSSVQEVLGKKIVALQILDNSPDIGKFNFDGFPSMFVYDSSKKQLTEINANKENSFLSAIEPYLKGSNINPTPIPSPPDLNPNNNTVDETTNEDIPTTVDITDTTNGELAPKKNSVLVGFTVRSGEIVDSIQPIYSVVNNGVLGETYKGELVGGKGGAEQTYLKNGYVVVGVSFRRGTWFDKKGVDSLVIKWMKWANGKPSGNIETSASIANYCKLLILCNDMPEPFDYTASNGEFIVGMDIKSEDREFGDIYLSDLKPTFSSQLVNSDGVIKNEINEYIVKKSNKADVSYDYQIKIVSGSKINKSASGKFSYDSSVLKGENVEFIEVFDFSFTYENKTYTANDLDWKPKIRFEKGKFINVFFVGGAINNRFGANVGFSRIQFGRPSEKFVRDGKSYFAYLNPYTIVDGVGRIEYKKR